jgi:hypothetical protein
MNLVFSKYNIWCDGAPGVYIGYYTAGMMASRLQLPVLPGIVNKLTTYNSKLQGVWL